jgi:hypothetical protein
VCATNGISTYWPLGGPIEFYGFKVLEFDPFERKNNFKNGDYVTINITALQKIKS